MAYRKVVQLGLLVLILFNCHETKKNDVFYLEASNGWDCIRVPLIKPYEVRKANPKLESSIWTMDFLYGLGTYNVKLIDVNGNLIYILAGKTTDGRNDSTLVNLENVPTGWYVIDTEKKIEKGFSSESRFKEFILKNNYNEPSWLSLDSLSKVFLSGRKLPWFPS